MTEVRLTDRKDFPVEIIDKDGSTLYSKEDATLLRNKLDKALFEMTNTSYQKEYDEMRYYITNEIKIGNNITSHELSITRLTRTIVKLERDIKELQEAYRFTNK